MFDRFRDDTSGQAYTLQGVVASLLVLGAVAFALQSTAITPLSASTASERVEEQNEQVAADTLEIVASQGGLSRILRYYNSTRGTFVGTPSDDLYFYPDSPPENTTLGRVAEGTLAESGRAYNIIITQQTDGDGDGVYDEISRDRLVYQGQPSDNAAAASYTVTLYDDMVMSDPKNGQTIKQDNGYLIDDASPGTGLYNVVEVKIVVWKT